MFPFARVRWCGTRRVLSGHACFVAAALAVAGWPATARAQVTRVANTTLTLPQAPQTFGYTTENAYPGITFNQPVGFATPPGETDRLFVLEKTGRIQVITGLNSTPVKQLFLDFGSKVISSSEEGLLGLAFHPDFATNRYFYVFYSTTATTGAGTGAHERVARFTALPPPATNTQILATEVPLLSQYDEADNHNGGDLHFGADGYLYVSLGDEGGGNDQYNNSQRIDKDFFSGLLRLDVDLRAGNLTPNAHPAVHAGTYRIPADNPFVGATTFNGAAVNPANVHTEFWAVGLRNPWRFSFDPPTGRLFVGDVGQGAREEIDLVTPGGNYGWNYREGTIAGPRGNPPAGAGFLDPIWDADRTTAASITGGLVYRGSRFPQLLGQYVFGDYVQNRVFAMSFPASGPVQVQSIATESTPVAFGADPRNGDILIANIGTGAIRRLVYNSTPTGPPLPATLTATGAFADLATLTPAAGIVPYEPNVSFWSDHAVKRRWFCVPALPDKITFAADGNWSFPAGTVWVKHFDLELTRGNPATARRLETRFLVKTTEGIYGITYRWNAGQTEATLVPAAGADEAITINDGGTMRTQTWHYPSRAECIQCHTPAGGLALSFNTAQLNRSYAYPAGAANQLTMLANAGYLDTPGIPDPATLRALAPAGDASATLEHRVRSYLAANCVQCHQPGGAAQGYWDARIQTPTAGAGLVNGPLVNPAGDNANRVIAPADAAHSMLLTRISTRGSGQMPPLASNELDPADIALLTAYIASLGAPVITTQPLSQTVAAGSPVTFTVATSAPTPTFQWRKDGVNIAGATGTSYTIGSVVLGDAGSYTVVATNTAGSATSNSATLTVNAPPAITTQPVAHFVTIGATVPFAVTATGYPAPTYQWRKNGVNLAGATSSTFYLNNAQLTSSATYSVVVTNPAGSVTSDNATLLVVTPPAHPVPRDFNNDGHADILWRNTVSGDVAIWFMNGTALQQGQVIANIGTVWQGAGTADFSGDGQTDILWRNTVSGDVALWVMNGTAFQQGYVFNSIPLVWQIGGTGDFNGDGKTDILWRNTYSGDVALWVMDGTTFMGGYVFESVPLVWQICGTGDFNGDGKTDILWRNTYSGDVALWVMNGTSFQQGYIFDSVVLVWQIVGTGDFNGDGKTDILWRNTVSGDVALWIMDGTSFQQGFIFSTIPFSWQIGS